MRRDAPRIAIVGVCGSGKTVLAEALQARGYNARSIAQEHSFVPGMWRAHGPPNILIYLDARPEVRAQRRYHELLARGQPAEYEVIYQEMLRRDRLDSSREAAPLRPADDAVIVDTSDLTVEEVLEWVLTLVDECDP